MDFGKFSRNKSSINSFAFCWCSSQTYRYFYLIKIIFSKVNKFFLVLLQAPDSVLIERAAGKRIDPKTGDVFHTTFDFPLEITIQQRLIVSENNTEEDLVNRLIVYHRYIGGVEDSLKANLKQINVDQPKGDVLNQSNYLFYYILL
jgi:adenylate kinase family enzyme